MFNTPPDPEAPWGFLSIDDLAHLRGAARRLDRTRWRERLPHLDAVLAEARAKGRAVVDADACLARLGDRSFALHALLRSRRAKLTWLGPALHGWFTEALAGPGAPPAWTRAWVARPRDRYVDDLDHAARVLVAAIRRDRHGERTDALRPLARALRLNRAPESAYMSAALLRIALAPKGGGWREFRRRWGWRSAQGARWNAADGVTLARPRAVRRIARVVATLAPPLLLERRAVADGFALLPAAERLALLAAPPVADDPTLAGWVADARRRAQADLAATTYRIVREESRDVALTDAEARLGARRVLPRDLALVPRTWIAAVRRTALAASATWRSIESGLDWAETHVLHYDPERAGLTAAHLLSLLDALPPVSDTVEPRRQRDWRWRRDRFWRLAFATAEIDLGWIHAVLRDELSTAVRASRRPKWLQAWVADARTEASDLSRILDLIGTVCADDAVRLASTRLLQVARAALLHPACPPEALASAVLAPALTADGAAGLRAFRARFATRWGGAALPPDVGGRLLRLLAVHAPELLPMMPAVDEAVAWMPPAEWAVLVRDTLDRAPATVRACAAVRGPRLSDAARAASVAAVARLHAGIGDVPGLATFPGDDARPRHRLTLALAYVEQRFMGEATLVVLPYVDGASLADVLGQYNAARRRYAAYTGEGPFGGLAWGDTIPALLRGDRSQNETPEYDDGRCDLLSCLGCLTVDCGGIRVRITSYEDTVVWDDFVHAYESEIGFPWVGPFTFDRAQYEAALDAVVQAAARLEGTVPIPPPSEPET